MQRLIRNDMHKREATGSTRVPFVKRKLALLEKHLLAPCIAILFAACNGGSNNPLHQSVRPDGGPNTQIDAKIDAGPEFSCAINQQLLEKAGVREVDSSNIRVHDGDTVSAAVTYRFIGVDAAEVANCIDGNGWADQHGVGEHSDTNYGQLGRSYVNNAIRAAQNVQVVADDRDQYGRMLVYFFVDNQFLQCLLVRNGLAYETVSHYGFGSHPELDQIVLDASEYAGQPHFVRPDLYRRQAAEPCQQ